MAAPDRASPEDLAAALREVLQPLARLAVHHGVLLPDFVEQLKQAYFEAARQAAADAGVPATDTAVALASGLHRKDVRRLREAEHAGLSPQPVTTRASAVVTRWLSDPAYQDADGKPRPLARSRADGASGFADLVESLTRDVRPAALLEELRRLDLVQIDAETDTIRLSVDAFLPAASSPEALYWAKESLRDHANASLHNLLGRGPRLLDQSAQATLLTETDVQELLTLLRGDWRQVLSNFAQAAGAREAQFKAAAQATEQPVPPQRLRVGMYVYAEPAPPPVQPKESES